MATLKENLSDCVWLNEPPVWSLSDDELRVVTGEKTDFWQDTFYGFHRDDGHFLGRDVAEDFTAVVGFEGEYETLYDQAGVMMRADGQNWLKVGIEHTDGVTNFSCVVTRDGRSDWSVIGVQNISGVQQVRLTRTAGAVIAHFYNSAGAWQLMRLADFPSGMPVLVGPMACSPERSGLDVRFLEFEVGPAIETPLHG